MNAAQTAEVDRGGSRRAWRHAAGIIAQYIHELSDRSGESTTSGPAVVATPCKS